MFRIPKRSKSAARFSLEEKFQIVLKCYVEKQDPKVVVPEFYKKHGMRPPIHPAQGISTFPAQIEQLVNDGDPEGLRLAKEYLPELLASHEGGVA